MLDFFIKPSVNIELILLSLIPFGDIFVQSLVIYVTLTQGTDEQLKGKGLVLTEGLDGEVRLSLRDYDFIQKSWSDRSSVTDLVSENEGHDILS